MKKLITNLSFAMFMIAVVLAIASCSKEDMQADDCAPSVPQAMESGALQYGAFTGTPLVEFRRSKSLSKTYFADILSNSDESFSTAKDFPFNSSANTYNVMKVMRKSEPGKYFWIMLENFRYKPGDSSYVYGNDESNAQLYGRMYHWSIAKQCEKKISMQLPRRHLNGEYTGDSLYFTYGRLPTVQDIEDLMEVSTPAVFEANFMTGPTLYDALDAGIGYYDAFISGRTYYGPDYNDSTYYHTLAGWLDNTDFYWWTHRDYCDLHEQVCFWTDTEWTSLPSTHFPFEIHYQNGEFVACLPTGAANNYGYYVRYVFEPTQLDY